MNFQKKDFNQQYYKLWEMGLLIPDNQLNSVYNVKYSFENKNFVHYDRILLRAQSPMDAMERASYSVTYGTVFRPEDVFFQAVYDEEDNLLWVDEHFYNVIQKKNEFRGLSRREFLIRFGATTAALLYGLQPDPANAGGFVPFAFMKKVLGGSQSFLSTGSSNWTCPAGVTSVYAIAIGGGSGGNGGYGGGGGGLRYRNAISVTPNLSYTVVVGAGGTNGVAGGDSRFGGTSNSDALVWAGGGSTRSGDTGGAGGTGSTIGGNIGGGDGGLAGGNGGNGGGGGGAGGYSGNGGKGGCSSGLWVATDGTGGAGGGGNGPGHNSGGGVGINGEGSSGLAGSVANTGGKGGSGGANAPDGSYSSGNLPGGAYGGGGGYTHTGGNGALKIKWGNGGTTIVSGQEPPYTTPGSYTWVAPAGVTSVCAVVVGGGGNMGSAGGSATCGPMTKSGGGAGAYGGGGGSLAWANDMPVTPGASYTVVVGAAGGNSSFLPGVSASQSGGGVGGTGGGSGNGTGGGAGGYTGDGGTLLGSNYGTGGAGTGGGAGSGGAAPNSAGAGGGVGLLGQTTNGAGGLSTGGGGGGGSGGAKGGDAAAGGGGLYGGGGAYGVGGGGSNAGASGAVRIIWGTGRSYPLNAT
jgi:hypothetical protein